MGSKKELLRLNNFIVQALSPSTREYGLKNVELYTLAVATLAEEFAWLSLGAEVGAFAVEDVDHVISLRLQMFVVDYAQFRPQWGSLFSSEVTALLDYVVQRGGSFRVLSQEFERPGTLIDEFQLASMLAHSFIQDVTAKWLIYGLVFAREDVWKEIMVAPISADDVVNVYSASVPEDYRNWRAKQKKAAIYAGYFKALRHMSSMAEFFSSERRPYSVQRSDWATLRIRVARIHGWRLDFWSSAIADRFREITGAIDVRLGRELGIINLKLGPSAFVGSVLQLMAKWQSLSQGIAQA